MSTNIDTIHLSEQQKNLLRKQGLLYRFGLDSSAGALLWITDRDNIIVDVSLGTATYMGLLREDIIGHPSEKFWRVGTIEDYLEENALIFQRA